MIRNPTRISSTKLRQQSKEHMLFCIITMPNQTAVYYTICIISMPDSIGRVRVKSLLSDVSGEGL